MWNDFPRMPIFFSVFVIISFLGDFNVVNATEHLIKIQPRYYRWHVDPGIPWNEKNTDHAHLDWIDSS